MRLQKAPRNVPAKYTTGLHTRDPTSHHFDNNNWDQIPPPNRHDEKIAWNVVRKAKQQELFIATTQLARSLGHPFYETLNKLLAEAGCEQPIEEIAADKGYHSAANIELSDSLDLRTYIPERNRKCKRKHKCRCNRNPSDFTDEELRAVKLNRDRMSRAKGKRLGRLRSKRVERSFAHVCDTGGGRRSR